MSSYFESSEDILARMKSGITNVSTIEGSDIHNVQAPVSIELSNTKLQLDEVLKKVFASTAYKNGYGEWLEIRCSEFGIERKAGAKASGYITFNGQAGATILADTIVTTQTGLRYFTIDSAIIPNGSTSVKVKVTAENIGSTYNKIANTIIYLPIKLINITGITNEEAFTNGYDIESDEALYQRYSIKVQTPSTSGNKYHYINWALEVTGVGSTKVYPLWDTNNGMNGNGTVKVVIANSDKRAASQELIDSVFSHIEDERPIGATVTVVSVTEKPISVIANIQISLSTTLDIVQSSFTTALENYLKDTFNSTKVSIMKIGSLLLDVDGVLDVDYSSIKLNNTADNVVLGNDEIAVLATNTPISLGVM